MEVAELVNAAGGLGRGKKMAGWVSPTGLQALHAPLGATLVRAPPQISMVVVGEVTCRRAGMVALGPRGANRALRYLHHAGIGLVLPKLG